ncbi:hypothetical protein SAMN05444411_1223 [Lutibacter oricola]|uniref:Uncharacterized protein n=1 Tax=Lutibacter oricola TaxID=762486 RepID=A0A1H3H0A6_9FLAO|nr:hypothetical protein [Lutibacter oricola]SDY09023.1 hypothetical protein SAMN05444411_1223 [Lutibacter oricola]
MFDIFKKNKITREKRFWNWFSENKEKLENFITSDFSDYSIYNRLTKELQKYNPLLFPEITINENDKFVLIITPDGMSDGVIPTQKLFDKKPEFENWIIKKFRQPTDEIGLSFDGLDYGSSDIKIDYFVDYEREKVDIKLLINNYNEKDKRYESLAWLYLDHILGEFNTISKVGAVIFEKVNEKKEKDELISILELRKLIDKELYKAST